MRKIASPDQRASKGVENNLLAKTTPALLSPTPVREKRRARSRLVVELGSGAPSFTNDTAKIEQTR